MWKERLRPRQWPWYAMQIAIVGFFLFMAFRYERETGENGYMLFLAIGVCVAAIATGIVAKLLDWLLAIRASLSGRVASKQNLTGQDLTLGRTGGPGSDGAKQIARPPIDQNPR